MIAVKNVEGKDLEVSFEGNTYIFPKDTALFIPEDLASHLGEIIPLAFDFNYKPAKGEMLPKVRFNKTKSIYPEKAEAEIDMKVSQGKMKADILEPDYEARGADFYGKGIEEDNLKE